MKRRIFISAVLLAALASLTPQPRAQAQGGMGAVYTMTNAAGGNAVVAYRRAANGTLTYQGLFPTGGRGSGGTIDPLQSQSSLRLSEDDRWLFAVNAGSGEISVFAVRSFGLILTDKTPSGGALPNSLAVYKNLLYVLNSGGNGNITGFTVRPNGRLVALEGSTRLLSAASAGGASIDLSPDGRVLAVTERLTDLVNTYLIGRDGLPQSAGPILNRSNGRTPFSLAWTPQGALLVAEAFGGPPSGDAALSSYGASKEGSLDVITGSTPTFGTAACWVVITRDGRYAYSSNAGSGTVSGFRIDNDNSLALLDPSGISATIGPGTTPLDIALTRNSRYFYTLNAGNGTISAFRVESSGNLTPLGSIGGLPAASGQNGLAAQ